VRPRVEPAEVGAQLLLGRPRPGRVGDDERSVDAGEHPLPIDVRRERGLDLLVGPDRTHVQQPAVVVEHGDPGRVLLTPGEVDAEVGRHVVLTLTT